MTQVQKDPVRKIYSIEVGAAQFLVERKVEPSPFFTIENVVFTRFKDSARVEEEIPLVMIL